MNETKVCGGDRGTGCGKELPLEMFGAYRTEDLRGNRVLKYRARCRKCCQKSKRERQPNGTPIVIEGPAYWLTQPVGIVR